MTSKRLKAMMEAQKRAKPKAAKGSLSSHGGVCYHANTMKKIPPVEASAAT
jgi:hypothetical protein